MGEEKKNFVVFSFSFSCCKFRLRRCVGRRVSLAPPFWFSIGSFFSFSVVFGSSPCLQEWKNNPERILIRKSKEKNSHRHKDEYQRKSH